MTLAYDLTVKQGEDYDRAIAVTDTGTGQPADITGWAVQGQIRAGYSSPTILHTLDVTASGTDVVLHIPKATSSAWTWRLARYDIELTAPSGKTTRFMEGSVVVYAEVTRPV